MTSPCPRRWLCPGPFVQQRVCWEAPGAWPGVYKWDAFQPAWFGSHRQNLLEVETWRFSRAAYNSEGSFLTGLVIYKCDPKSLRTHITCSTTAQNTERFVSSWAGPFWRLSQSFPTFLWGAADFFPSTFPGERSSEKRTVTAHGPGAAIDDPTGLIRTQRTERRQIYFIFVFTAVTLF